MPELVPTPADKSSSSAFDRLRPYTPVFAAYVVSRLVIFLAALAVEAHLVPVNPQLTHGDPAPILRSLTTWDGAWFVGIARDGYHLAPFGDAGYHDYAFFPLYPLVVRALAYPVPGLVALVAIVLNHLLLIVALVLLVRLARPHLGHARAVRAAALLALSPFSFVYSMAYSEPLTLVAVVAAFIAAERGFAGRTGVSFAVASLTRAQSAFYLIPLAIASRLSVPNRARWALLSLGPIATLAYLGWVAIFTGHWNGYVATYAAWRDIGGAAAGSRTVGEALSSPLGPYFWGLMICLVVSVGLFVFARVDRIPLAYMLIPAISLVMSLISGSLESIGRVVLLAFPYSWIVASRQHPAWRYGWPLVSVALLALLSTLTFAGWWIP